MSKMKIVNIEHDTFTKEHAERARYICGADVQEGDLIYGDITLDGVTYRRTGRYKGEHRQSEESVRSFFDDPVKCFKREYHWIFTLDQVGGYCYYRSARQLNTLSRSYPDRFIA